MNGSLLTLVSGENRRKDTGFPFQLQLFHQALLLHHLPKGSRLLKESKNAFKGYFTEFEHAVGGTLKAQSVKWDFMMSTIKSEIKKLGTAFTELVKVLLFLNA